MVQALQAAMSSCDCGDDGHPKLSEYMREIARLGGYLARSHDPPPGNMIMWRGWTRLMDIQLGAELAAGALVGN